MRKPKDVKRKPKKRKTKFNIFTPGDYAKRLLAEWEKEDAFIKWILNG